MNDDLLILLKIIIVVLALIAAIFFVGMVGTAASRDEAENRADTMQTLAELAIADRDRATSLAEQIKAENEMLKEDLDDWNHSAAGMKYGDADQPAWTPAGEFRIYYYCPCEICTSKKSGDPTYGVTATGTVATEGQTVAVDPDIIPLGSEVLINGVIYIAEDTGVAGKTIDIFINDHAQATAMGTYVTTVSWR